MHSPIKEDLPASAAPVLRTELLVRIHALNLDYLDLLAAELASDGCAAQLQFFPPKLQPSFAALSASDRKRIAHAPYALYSLCFEDVRFWQTACEPSVEPLDARYVCNASSWLQGPFCEIALIQAWQVTMIAPLAARVLYAMSEPVSRLLVATPLWQVKRIAGDYPGLLLPRWPGNRGFWPDLISFSQSNDLMRLATTQLLGLQLIAAELGASTNRGSPGVFSRSNRSPHVRVRRI